MNRPMPPADLGEYDGKHPLSFYPAEDIWPWVEVNLLNGDSKLFNRDHIHLAEARIGFLWAAYGFETKMRQIIGLTEETVFRGNKWAKGRHDQQLAEWFGAIIPDFLITLDGSYCLHCSDAEFCALLEHELYHVGQERNAFGEPAFHRDTGLPKLTMRGHDVEEFIGVVRRYGTGQKESTLARMVEAANRGPEIAQVSIAQACGTCLLRAA